MLDKTSSEGVKLGFFSNRKEGWRRLGLELVVVFLGVLIALFVDGWNDHRIERRLENEYLQRLVQNIARDSQSLSDLSQALQKKFEALRWLQTLDRDQNFTNGK